MRKRFVRLTAQRVNGHARQFVESSELFPADPGMPRVGSSGKHRPEHREIDRQLSCVIQLRLVMRRNAQ